MGGLQTQSHLIKGFNFKKHFQDYSVTPSTCMSDNGFHDGQIAEYKELLNMPSKAQMAQIDEHAQDMLEQLKEGYPIPTKDDTKRILEALTNIPNGMSACC